MAEIEVYPGLGLKIVGKNGHAWVKPAITKGRYYALHRSPLGNWYQTYFDGELSAQVFAIEQVDK